MLKYYIPSELAKNITVKLSQAFEIFTESPFKIVDPQQLCVFMNTVGSESVIIIDLDKIINEILCQYRSFIIAKDCIEYLKILLNEEEQSYLTRIVVFYSGQILFTKHFEHDDDYYKTYP
jgi:hypothetical protein